MAPFSVGVISNIKRRPNMSYDEIIRTPGKFEGERLALKMAYEASLEGNLDEEFGSVQENGYYCRVYLKGLEEPICFMENEYGFIFEISNEEFEKSFEKWSEETDEGDPDEEE